MRFRRRLSLGVVVLLIACLSASAFAANVAPLATPSATSFALFSDLPKSDKAYHSVELLTELGIFQGFPDGSVRADQPLTRAEFTVIVTRLLGRERLAKVVADLPTEYADDDEIEDWARGHINFAKLRSIVTGYDDGRFRPNAYVTNAEALTMLIRALGLEPAATGQWPESHLRLAEKIGLTRNLDLVPDMPITRGEMAIASENALLADYAWDPEKGLIRSEHGDGSYSLIVQRHGWSVNDWASRPRSSRTLTQQ